LGSAPDSRHGSLQRSSDALAGYKGKGCYGKGREGKVREEWEAKGWQGKGGKVKV